MPKVSIIMPVYNVEKYFRKSIESLINQTLQDIEIIPVDDGSPDNCGKIMDEYAELDKRIKPIHQQNGGYGKAVNVGISAANGEYIGIVEPDDFAEPEMFEQLYNQAKAVDADVCKCDFSYYCGKNKYYNPKYMEDIAKQGEVFTIIEKPEIMKYHVSIWSAIYRKDYLQKHNIKVLETEKASYQDMPFAASVYAHKAKITVIPKSLINYRTEAGMDSSTIRTDERLRIMPIMCCEAKKIFQQNNVWDCVKPIAYWHFYNCSVGMFFQTEDKYKFAHYLELKKLFEDITNDKENFKFFGYKEKYLISLIVTGKYKLLFFSVKLLGSLHALKMLRRKIISIRYNKKEKSLNILGQYFRFNREKEKVTYKK